MYFGEDMWNEPVRMDGVGYWMLVNGDVIDKVGNIWMQSLSPYKDTAVVHKKEMKIVLYKSQIQG
jgi:hypothetical protein